MKDLTLTIYMITRNTQNYYARELKKLGISMGQFPFIMKIAENDGISQERLSEKLSISKSNTTLIIKQLMENGLIKREVNVDDRRNFKLHVTAKGAELIPEIVKVIDACHNKITAKLSAEEKNLLLQMLDKVYSNSEYL